MAITTRILVLANRTVDAPTLLAALRRRTEAGPIAVTLLMPVRSSERETASARAEHAIATLAADGIAARAILSDADPFVAVEEEYDNRRYDEILVSTLTVGKSQWLAADVPERIRRRTDAVVRQVTVPRAEIDPPVIAPASRPLPRRSVLEGMLRLLRVDTNRVGHPHG